MKSGIGIAEFSRNFVVCMSSCPWKLVLIYYPQTHFHIDSWIDGGLVLDLLCFDTWASNYMVIALWQKVLKTTDRKHWEYFHSKELISALPVKHPRPLYSVVPTALQLIKQDAGTAARKTPALPWFTFNLYSLLVFPGVAEGHFVAVLARISQTLLNFWAINAIIWSCPSCSTWSLNLSLLSKYSLVVKASSYLQSCDWEDWSQTQRN